jgi:Flp pilus assembly protein TadG
VFAARNGLAKLLSAGRREEGAAALEFALVLPVLLILLLGTISVGHGLVLRFLLSSAAYDAARVCALKKTPTTACATQAVADKLKGLQKWCSSTDVKVQNKQAQGFTEVSSVQVELDCHYNGIISTAAYLGSHGMLFGNVRAKAVMPY